MIIPLRANAPRYDTPYVTYSLLLVNVFVFLIQLADPGGPQAVIDSWGLQPARIWSGGTIPGTTLPAWLTVWTSNYLHFDIGHIIGNMLILWLMGPGLEWLCGRARFLAFYTLSGVLAGVATAAIGAASSEAGAGASGALAGVLGAYLLMFPRARVTSLMWISPFSWMSWATGTWGLVTRNISVFWFAGSWIILQLLLAGLAGTMAEDQGPYGVYAHAAGAVAGMLLIFLARIPERMPPDDHPVRVGELSSVIVGDEGDAGDGYVATTPEMAEAEWRRSPEGRLQQRILELRAPFEDRFAHAMLEHGDYAGARAHCSQMLELAQQAQNDARIEGYGNLLDEIEARIAALPPVPLAARRAYQPADQAWSPEAATDGGIPRAADPFNLGHVPRASRRTASSEPEG
jgi:membrane associated rhomboid family serine protease